METLGIDEEINYTNIFPKSYYVLYGISIIFVSCIIFKSCRKRENGKNRLRREYIV
jgi:hypothetical protein